MNGLNSSRSNTRYILITDKNLQGNIPKIPKIELPPLIRKIWIHKTPRWWLLKNSDRIPLPRPNKRVYPKYNNQLHLIVRFLYWRSGEWEALLNYHYSQVHSLPRNLLVSHQWIKKYSHSIRPCSKKNIKIKTPSWENNCPKNSIMNVQWTRFPNLYAQNKDTKPGMPLKIDRLINQSEYMLLTFRYISFKLMNSLVNDHDSLTSWHKITLDRLTHH